MTSLFDLFYTKCGTKESFNLPLEAWEVSSVTVMLRAIRGTSSFNQSLNSWDISRVTDLGGVLESTAFNQPLVAWDTSAVTRIHGMFYDTPFNQDISPWVITSVTSAEYMFTLNFAFNQVLCWDLTGILTSQMFVNSYGSTNTGAAKCSCIAGEYYDTTNFGCSPCSSGSISYGKTESCSVCSSGVSSLDRTQCLNPTPSPTFTPQPTVTPSPTAPWCMDLSIVMSDSYGDGWNGNVLNVGGYTFTVSSGSYASETVCLMPGTYSPYVCGGIYDNEVSWSIGGLSGSADDLCAATAGSFSVIRPTSSPTKYVPPTPAPTPAPTVSPTFAPTFAPTIAPMFAPTIAPTFSPTFAPNIVPTLRLTYGPTFMPIPAPAAGTCFSQKSTVSVLLPGSEFARSLPLSMLEVGTRVLAADSNNKKIYAMVTDLHSSPAAEPYLSIRVRLDSVHFSIHVLNPYTKKRVRADYTDLSTVKHLTVTRHHTFPVCHEQKFLPAFVLKVGDCLHTVGGRGKVESIELSSTNENDMTYTIVLEENIHLVAIGGIFTRAKPGHARSTKNMLRGTNHR